MTPVRVTFAVDSVREFEASLKSLGFAILQPPTRVTTGSNMLVRDVDGGVFEFVETRTSGPCADFATEEWPVRTWKSRDEVGEEGENAAS